MQISSADGNCPGASAFYFLNDHPCSSNLELQSTIYKQNRYIVHIYANSRLITETSQGTKPMQKLAFSSKFVVMARTILSSIYLDVCIGSFKIEVAFLLKKCTRKQQRRMVNCIVGNLEYDQKSTTKLSNWISIMCNVISVSSSM